MSKGPKYRVVFKDADGENYKVGAIWESDKGYLSLSPIVEPNDEYGEMAFEDALEQYADKKGFFNLYANEQKKSSNGKRRRRDDAESDFE